VVLKNIDDVKPFSYFLLKVASRCNLNCTYCYWFRDNSVYEKEKFISEDVQNALINRFNNHLRKYNLSKFYILIHGGEPLLFGKEQLDLLCTRLRRVAVLNNCNLTLSLTTNGVLIDEEWIAIFKKQNIKITISIDGPPEIHDKKRIDFKYRGTSEPVLNGYKLLKSNAIDPGILAVCDPTTDPESYTSFFINKLHLKHFDILIPDSTHEDRPESISAFYIKLFDLWFDRYLKEGIKIRIIESMVKGLFGHSSGSESIGFVPVQTITILTDGSIEPLDVLRTIGDGATATNLNVLKDEIQSIANDNLWNYIRDSSTNLASECQICPYMNACGGGHIGSRWSDKNKFDNPSVYCNDFKEIFSHICNRIGPTLFHKAS